MTLLISVLIGAVIGWIASMILQSKATGILYNMILGIVGGFVSSWLAFSLELTSDSWKNVIITAAIGAIVVIIAGRMLVRKKPQKPRRH